MQKGEEKSFTGINTVLKYNLTIFHVTWQLVFKRVYDND